MEELDLFGKKQKRKVKALFTDYESWLEKFSDKGHPKTTDDCYTQEDVYEAIVQWLIEEGAITAGTPIVRPFFPGGDYINTDYPAGAVVVDNPPFSKFIEIIRFYTSEGIPFFLFGNGMTILSASEYCTAIIIHRKMIFENGATICVNFASNLFGDIMAMTAPRLSTLVKACKSQQNTRAKTLARIAYPPEVLRASDLQTIAEGGGTFVVMRGEGVTKPKVCGHTTFGSSILIGKEKAKEKEKEKAKGTNFLRLTAEEEIIVRSLSKTATEDNENKHQGNTAPLNR